MEPKLNIDKTDIEILSIIQNDAKIAYKEKGSELYAVIDVRENFLITEEHIISLIKNRFDVINAPD